jgi:hypothetical protein
LVNLKRPPRGLDEDQLDVPSYVKGISQKGVISQLEKLADEIKEELDRVEFPPQDMKPIVLLFGCHPLSIEYYALERVFSRRRYGTLSFHDECLSEDEFYDFVSACMIAVDRSALGEKEAHDFLQKSFKDEVEEDINDVKPFLLLYMSYRTVVPFKPRAFTKLKSYYRDKNIKDGHKVLRKHFELTDEDTRYIVGDRYGITGRQVSAILKKDSVFDADIKKINTYIPLRAYRP